MTAYTIRDTAHWHDLRRTHVGSSDAAILFGISQRKTVWQLHMEKAGKLPPIDLDDVTYVRNGKFFEPAIAAIGADKFGIQIRKVHRYLESDDCPALGCSVDFEEIGSGSLAPVEIKWSVFGQGWDWDGDTITEAPEDYLIQTQTQLACMPSAPYARLWAFIQGDVRQMIVEPRPKIIDAIKAQAAQFMADVAAGKEPPVDFNMDAEAIGRLAAINPMVNVDLPPECEALCAAYKEQAALEKAAETAKKAAQAQITKTLLDLAAAKGATVDEQKVVAEVGGWKVSASMVAANPGQTVTPEMIGQVIGARKGYRRMTIGEKKS